MGRTVRPRRALAQAVSALVLTGFAGTGGASALAQTPAAPEVVPSISVANADLLPATPVDGTATFSVPSLAPEEISAVQVAVEVRDDPNHHVLLSVQDGGGAGLTGCTPRARAFVCQVADITVPGEYSLPFELIPRERLGSEYPVTAQVAATWSYATTADAGTPLMGGEAMEVLTVRAPARTGPPAGFAVSASCVDDTVTVVIEADDPEVTFFANFSEGPVPPQAFAYPAGGDGSELIVVGDAGDPYTVLREIWFAETVECASAPPDTSMPGTTVPPPAAGPLPETGPSPASLAIGVLALTAAGIGSLLLLLRRTF